MPTRIRALASFSNRAELAHLKENHIVRGETTLVRHSYALELRRSGLAEILETEVEEGGAEPESESQESTSGSTEDDEQTGEAPDTDPADRQGEEMFSHTEFVAPDGTLTDELPKHGVLADRGVTTFDDLAEIASDFQQVKGIGPASEKDLNAAWQEIVSNR